MIPSVVASEVTGALRDFLTTGFGPSSPELASVVTDFLADPENLVKGPYLSVALPFRRAPEGGEPFPDPRPGAGARAVRLPGGAIGIPGALSLGTPEQRRGATWRLYRRSHHGGSATQSNGT